MRILHTVENYYPVSGGAGIAVQAVSEERAQKGHDVTVATGFSPRRDVSVLNGVTVEQFKISGNAVKGFKGEVETYQKFLRSRPFDVVLNYAAQTWASDLAFPILDSIAGRKVFAPCGYSRLRTPAYKRYYEELPAILRRYDAIVYFSANYQANRGRRRVGHLSAFFHDGDLHHLL